MSNLHQKAIEGVCAEALMRVTPQARVQILRRLLKIAVQDAKRSPEPDPRQTSFEEVFHGPYEKEATAPSMREPKLSTVCVWGPPVPFSTDGDPFAYHREEQPDYGTVAIGFSEMVEC